jgi:hypothetical protein
MDRNSDNTWIDLLKRDFPYFVLYGDPKEHYEKIKNGNGKDFYVTQSQFSKRKRILYKQHFNHPSEIYWRVDILGNEPPIGEVFALVLFKPKKLNKSFGLEFPALAFKTHEDALRAFSGQFDQISERDFMDLFGNPRWAGFKINELKSEPLKTFLEKYFENDTKIEFVIDKFTIGEDLEDPVEYRKRGYYKASKNTIENFRQNNIFSWLCLQSYMTTPVINAILFKLNGDWTKFDDTFGNVIETHLRVARYADKNDPYNIFNTFFKAMLIESANVGKFLYDRSGIYLIETEEDLISNYPEMKAFLSMDNESFTLAYIAAIQNAIMSVPKLSNPVFSFRGYTPLGIPNTLTLTIDDLEIGQEITTWGFMSVSLSPNVSATFLKAEQKCCLLKVVIPENMYAFLIQSGMDDKEFPRNLAPFEGEEEILLPAGTIVRVIKKTGIKEFSTMKNEIVETNTARVEVIGFESPKLPEVNPIEMPLLKLRCNYL